MNDQTLTERAVQASKDKDWDTAVELWRTVKDQEVDNPKASTFVFLTRALRMVDQINEAEATIHEALHSGQDHASLWREAAVNSAKLKKWDEAEQSWRRYFELVNEDMGQTSSVHYDSFSDALRRQGKFDEASEVIKKGKDAYPNDIGLLNRQEQIEAERILASRRVAKPSVTHGSTTRPSVEEICECFWKVEKELDLINWKINGVSIWPLIRMHLYGLLTQEYGVFDPPHPVRRQQKSQPYQDPLTSLVIEQVNARLKGRRNIFQFQNSDLESQLSCKDSAILMSSRKLDGSDPYTEALRKEIGNSCILLDRSDDIEVKAGSINFDLLSNIFYKKYQRSECNLILSSDRIFCQEIRDKFIQNIGCDLPDIVKRAQSALVIFYAIRLGFGILWEIYPIRKFYLTNSYGVIIKAAMVAAQEHGAKVIELQHGVITRFHLGYSWPEQPTVPYSPDELWCFGDYWYREATSLAGNVKGRTIGAPYVKKLAKLSEVKRDPDLVVFSSQGAIGQRLFQIALTVSGMRPDKKFVFRLHPSELLKEYEKMLKASRPAPENLSLSHKNPVVFELLAQASVQVGVFSTTLLEGLTLQTPSIVVKLPGFEYMEPVVNRGDSIIVQDAKELAERLDEAPIPRDSEYYYSEPVEKLVL